MYQRAQAKCAWALLLSIGEFLKQKTTPLERLRNHAAICDMLMRER